ncbi:uncharacterized protein LOC123310423 [Coccinella septempunctata]|uniref:uncharacterized protein LOC123310423 n=1 Tax=Coccinella septempunctata TaxID=41139 RepID=UPI001D07816B|nr:uncharacterized protein LOC123310423 [Coccinella septempunctata]
MWTFYLMIVWLPLFLLCEFIFSEGAGFYEGDQCTSAIDGRKGKCSSVYDCSWAISMIRAGQKVHTCSFNGKIPIVCCPLDGMKDRYQTSEEIKRKDSRLSGQMSIRKCEEYYPTLRRPTFVVAAVGGEVALSEEFPHMALLGYGTETEKEWKCGGSLISLQHILTAAHCLHSRDLGDVKFVRLGELDIASNKDIAEPQDYYVKRAFPHPDFDSTTMKHDIAILQLHDSIRVTSFVKPACLFVERDIDEYSEITATGWGITEFAGEPSSKLIKVRLKIIGNEKCRQQYVKSGDWSEIDDENQVCAGSADEGKIMDTCQGDSGGPLQVTNYTNSKHYMIMGVTSFGKACGIVNSAGVYTRVSSYLSWIESIVYEDTLKKLHATHLSEAILKQCIKYFHVLLEKKLVHLHYVSSLSTDSFSKSSTTIKWLEDSPILKRCEIFIYLQFGTITMLLFLVALWFPLLVFCKVLFSNNVPNFYEGDQCTLGNRKTQGICFSVKNCSWALERIKQRQHVDLCGFIGKEPIVCCPSSEKFDSGPLRPSNSSLLNTSNNSALQKDTASSIAWSKEKCEQYYPPREGVNIVGVGGERSLAQEFPHMAILGFGDEDDISWKCGGSLISHQHVLTAAHCLSSRDLGTVKYVRVGDLDILNDTDFAEPQDFKVKLAIQHPEFDPSTLKHDIAILVLDKPVRVTDYVKPACLFTGGAVDEYGDVTATGWGITEFAGQPSSHLIKLKLKIVDNADCRKQYKNVGIKGIIDADLQVCAGSADPGKIVDTCEGDSGGPLQLTEYVRRKHYLVIGVTSFGKACGITKSAGVYTSVASHIPWIENIVTNNL